MAESLNLDRLNLEVCADVESPWIHPALVNQSLKKLPIFPVNGLDFDLDKVPFVYSKLLQRIQINLDGQGVDPFLPFLTHYSAEIEQILFQGSTKFLPQFALVLDNVEFPNLKKISLLEIDNLEDEEVAVVRKTGTWITDEQYLNPRLSIVLNTVQILDVGNIREDNFALYQQLIDLCCNLEWLKFNQHFYPNLENCHKIKSLVCDSSSTSLSHYPTGLSRDYYESKREQSILNLHRVLEETKDSLEELDIGSFMGYDNATLWSTIYELGKWNPVMPKLVRLTLHEMEMFPPIFYCKDQLPALKELTLGTRKGFEFPPTPEFGQFVTATNVSLRWWYYFGQIEAFRGKGSFPNLKTLSIWISSREKDFKQITKPGDKVKVTDAKRFENALVSIPQSFPSLVELTITVRFGTTLSELLGAIFSNDISGKELKRIEVLTEDVQLVVDDDCQNFPHEDFYLRYRRDLVLKGFAIGDKARKKLQTIKVENGLHVQLIN